MKGCLLIVLVMLFGSCGSDNTNNGNNGTGKPGTDSVEETGADTLVWVGIFARWLYDELETYDGSYDTLSNIFVLCSNNQAIEVPREKIKFQASGFCDTAAGNRIKLMIRKSDSVKIITNQLKVIDHKGIYKIGNEEKSIRINEKALDRIRKTGIRSATPLPRATTPTVTTVNRKDSLRRRAYTVLKDSVQVQKPRLQARQ